MRGINVVIIAGNLGADAELRHTTDGTAVTSLNVAVNERYTDRNGQVKEKTIWVRVNVWKKAAEALIPYLKKGQAVHVVGRLIENQWTEEDTGKLRTKLELRARDVTLLGSPGSSREKAPDWEPGDDDIPF